MKLSVKNVSIILLIVLATLLIGYFMIDTSPSDNEEPAENIDDLINNTNSNMNNLDMYAVEETIESTTNSDEFYTEYDSTENKFYRETSSSTMYYVNGTTEYTDGSTPKTKNRTSTVPFELITTNNVNNITQTDGAVRIEGSDMQKYPRNYIEQVMDSSNQFNANELSVNNFTYEIVIDRDSERARYMKMQIQNESQKVTFNVSFDSYSLSGITSLQSGVDNSEEKPVLENIDHPTAPNVINMSFNNEENLVINVTNVPQKMTDLWVVTSNVRKSIPMETGQKVILEDEIDYDSSQPMVEVRAEFQDTYSISLARYR